MKVCENGIVRDMTPEEIAVRIHRSFGGNLPSRADRCVCCGEIVPEGRMVCPSCERGTEK